MVQDFKNLEIWKKAYDFALEVYGITADFPTSEQYALTQQLRRAATSISANIAEGCGRRTKKEFLRFLYVAMGSVKECENFLMLAKDLGYLKEERFYILNNEIQSLGKMLNTFIQKLVSINK